MIGSSKLMPVVAAAGIAVLAGGAVRAAGEGPHIERQPWSFSGLFGQFDQAQLQRGYQVYSEVCANCHELRRIHYRNLAQPGGPAFPKDAVAALAPVSTGAGLRPFVASDHVALAFQCHAAGSRRQLHAGAGFDRRAGAALGGRAPHGIFGHRSDG